MKQLKLEVGKTYRSRAGKEVKIVRKDNMNIGYPYQGSDDEWYTESGRFDYQSQESPYDLIEEVPSEPTRHTFDIPDGVKKVTVEQVGNRIVVEMVPEERKEPKPGDVMINKHGNVYIFKAINYDGWHNHFAWIGSGGRVFYSGVAEPGRPATPEEAQPLWDALKKAGKRWNPVTQVVEEFAEKEQIDKFLEAYADGVIWSRKQLRWLIENYLKKREGE